jgi:hypothetical protein
VIRGVTGPMPTAPPSKILSLFEPDEAALPVYNLEKGRVSFATDYGVSSRTVKKDERFAIPLYQFSDAEIEDRIVLLLLDSIRISGWRRNAPDPKHDFEDVRDLNYHITLSSSDHRIIPESHYIAVAEPEFLGRVITHPKTGQRGAFLFNHRAVIGFRISKQPWYSVLMGM